MLKGRDFPSILDDPEFEWIFSDSIRMLAQQEVERVLRVKGWFLSSYDKEDIVQNLTIHLLMAVRKFDPSRGVSLLRYLTKFLRRGQDLIVKVIRLRDIEDLETELKSDYWDDDVDEDEKIKSPLEFIVDLTPSPEEQALSSDSRRHLTEKVVQGRRTCEVAEQRLENFLEQEGNKVARHRCRKIFKETSGEIKMEVH